MGFWLLMLVAAACHAEEAPDPLVKRIAEETLTSIRADKDLQSATRPRSRSLSSRSSYRISIRAA